MPANDAGPKLAEHADEQDSKDTLSWSWGWWLGNAKNVLSS